MNPFSTRENLLDYICNSASEKALQGMPDRVTPWEDAFDNWVEDLGRREGEWLRRRRAKAV